MIALLDTFRDTLEDLGGGLGVTDPVSGERLLNLPSGAAGGVLSNAFLAVVVTLIVGREAVARQTFASAPPTAAADYDEAHKNHRRAQDMNGGQAFVEEYRAKNDCGHRHEEGHQHQVDRTGGGKNAIEDGIPEKRRYRTEPDQRAPNLRGRHRQGPGAFDHQR